MVPAFRVPSLEKKNTTAYRSCRRDLGDHNLVRRRRKLFNGQASQCRLKNWRTLDPSVELARVVELVWLFFAGQFVRRGQDLIDCFYT